MISRVPFPNCRSGVIGPAIAGNPENDVHLSRWQLPASKVGSCVDRQRTHMRTYQKHVGLSMLSFLSCVSLPIPCQALGREKTFPAIVRGITRKMLILQESAPEIEKFSLLFPVGRENADRTHAVHASTGSKARNCADAAMRTPEPFRPDDTVSRLRFSPMNEHREVRPASLFAHILDRAVRQNDD